MKKEWKSDKSPVTITDIIINKMVIDAAKKQFPGHGIIAEEGSDYSGQEYVWVCDPVDGTIPFSHGVPTCMFLLALVKNGESILGVAYDPFMDSMYFAEKNKGAFLNNKKITVSNRKKLDNKAVIGIVAWKEAKFQYPDLFVKLLDLGVENFNVGFVGYMDASVANGEFSAVICPSIHPWDSAAPKIIVEEAGGKVTDLFGKELDFRGKVDGSLVSNGQVHGSLVRLIKKYIYAN